MKVQISEKRRDNKIQGQFYCVSAFNGYHIGRWREDFYTLDTRREKYWNLMC